MALLRNTTRYLVAKIVEVRIQPRGIEDYTIEPQKFVIIQPDGSSGEEKKNNAEGGDLEGKDGATAAAEDIEMKEVETNQIIDTKSLEPIDNNDVPIIDGVWQIPAGRKLKYDYYVHYVGHQRRNDRWCHEDEIKVEEEEIQKQL